MKTLPPKLPIRTDALHQVMASDTRELVQQVVEELPERDRRILRSVILEERDKDEVCEGAGVDRDYLRVLQHRALISFKKLYLERTALRRQPVRVTPVRSEISKA